MPKDTSKVLKQMEEFNKSNKKSEDALKNAVKEGEDLKKDLGTLSAAAKAEAD